LSLKKTTIKVRRKQVIPIIPKNARNLNLSILLTNAKGSKNNEATSTINFYDS
jgi:hypothetical protein